MDAKTLLLDAMAADPSRSAFLVAERIVYTLLERHLAGQGKMFVPEPRSRGTGGTRFDALAPDGLDDLPGPTAIDLVRVRFQAKNWNNREVDILAALSDAAVSGCRSFLLVLVGEALEAKRFERLRQLPSRLATPVSLRVWDIDKVAQLATEYAEYLSDLVPGLAPQGIKNVVAASTAAKGEAWKEERVRCVTALVEARRRDELVLLLGAGVSFGTGLPSWERILLDLSTELISEQVATRIELTQQEREFLAERQQNIYKGAPLLAARYLQEGLKPRFEQVVAATLYRNLSPDKEQTPVLAALARLCVPRRGAVGVRSVVTYNFDDLLEANLKLQGVLHQSIFREGDAPASDFLPVFHVHGFLPRDPSAYDGISDAQLVFSEEGYHALYRAPYAWSNMVQLQALREGVCLLVGLSGTDPNLRRLLEIAAEKAVRDRRPRHFIVLKRILPTEFVPDGGQRKDVVETFLAAHHALVENSFRPLGLNVIWVDRWEELPGIIDEICK